MYAIRSYYAPALDSRAVHAGDFTRRAFLESSLAASACLALPSAFRHSTPWRTAAPHAFELEEITIAALQEGMRTGKYTSVKLCELYLSRIDDLDRHGPTLRSVIEVNPDALDIVV